MTNRLRSWLPALLSHRDVPDRRPKPARQAGGIPQHLLLLHVFLPTENFRGWGVVLFWILSPSLPPVTPHSQMHNRSYKTQVKAYQPNARKGQGQIPSENLSLPNCCRIICISPRQLLHAYFCSLCIF